jgi:hypothetical protein
LIYSRQ